MEVRVRNGGMSQEWKQESGIEESVMWEWRNGPSKKCPKNMARRATLFIATQAQPHVLAPSEPPIHSAGGPEGASRQISV